MLNKLEELEEEAAEEEVPIIPWEFESKRMDGLYVNGAIALGTHLKTYAEKACTLAEEMGLTIPQPEISWIRRKSPTASRNDEPICGPTTG